MTIFGGYKKQDFVKCLKINNLQSRRPKADPGEFEGVRPLIQYSAKGTKKASPERCFFVCLGWDSNPYGRFGPRDFLTTMAFATISVCGPDYSFTMDHYSLGVPCLVSAPSSFQRLGSRLPSALSVKVSLNLRHSTSLFSESALKCALPR